MPPTKVADLDDEAWRRTIDINLSGLFLCLKHELHAMQEQEGGGAIVNIASAGVLKVAAPQPDYIASKSGVVGITRSAAADCGKAGVHVNAVLPGPTATPMLMAGFDARTRSVTRGVAVLGRGRLHHHVASRSPRTRVITWSDGPIRRPGRSAARSCKTCAYRNF
ncbi:SDR family NAD(P)-dependent oxidoreductase [Georgenia sp. AZ-5]|uniref:SDR family NAD(P)-dependent oxidoreductase n=1 Tax=Georgenia sp. AZ-5 TaxID=3367526 RepID=UPI0037544AB4